ncbi:MAG: glycosyl transferase, family 2 [Elusimicrobiota bacterium]
MISVVIPAAGGAGDAWLPRIFDRLRAIAGLEVLCVGTPPAQDGIRAVRLAAASRAVKLQAGIEAASHSLILLHHPRSLIDATGLRWLSANAGDVSWGGFTHAFDSSHPLLRLTSWYSNRIRAQRRGIVYLDHCIFFRRELLVRPIPPVEIFEDTELSMILRESGPPRILPFLSTTSSVRFRKNGIWRQSLMNQRLKLEYRMGRSDRAMNRRYERGLDLN